VEKEQITKCVYFGIATHPRSPIVIVYPNLFNESFMIDVSLYVAKNLSINVYSMTRKLV
jgi:hypothetical protein